MQMEAKNDNSLAYIIYPRMKGSLGPFGVCCFSPSVRCLCHWMGSGHRGHRFGQQVSSVRAITPDNF